MTDQTDQNSQPRVFTARVEANYADELREKRDVTDADIRADYIQRLSDEDVAGHRARETSSRVFHERTAIVSAIHVALNRADDAARRDFPSREYDDQTTSLVADDLNGATITVTLTDLVAEATVTLPPRT